MGGQLPLRSVDSQIKRRAIEPRNLFAVSLRCCQMRGPRQATYPWSTQPAWSRRGRRTGRMITRVPWELGRPCRLHRHVPAGARLTNSRMNHSQVPDCGDKPGTKQWYRQAKATKCGEMGGRESEHFILATKRGNGPSRTPWSQGGAALQTGGRHHAEGIEPPSVSPRGGRIV